MRHGTVFLKVAILAVLALGTTAFGIGAVYGLSSPKPQASLDPPHAVFQTQETLDELFPSGVHFVPIQIIATEPNESVLEHDVLLELFRRSNELRGSELAETHFIEVGNDIPFETFGFFTLSDALQLSLEQMGTSLETATQGEIEAALHQALEQPYLRSQLSRHAEQNNGNWLSPAMYFFVWTDKDVLGGGPFRRNIGGDHVTIEKERFNRQIEQALQGDSYRALGIGIDLNLEADEQGYSFAVLLRIATLIIALGLFAGFFLRSWRAGVLIGLGSLALFVWIRGASHFLGDVLRPSLTTDVILPLAILAFGVDFALHVIRQMHSNDGSSGRLRNALRILGATLLVVAVTDATAFAANSASTVEAVRNFGIMGGIACFFALFIMGICIPMILESWDAKILEKSPNTRLMDWLSDSLCKGRAQSGVICATMIISALSTAYASGIERSFDVRDFFDPESNIVQSLEERDHHFGDIRGEEAAILLRSDALNAGGGGDPLEEVHQTLQDNPHLARGRSGDLVQPRGTFPVVELEGTFATQVVYEIVDTRELENVALARERIESDLGTISGLEYDIAGPPFERQASLSGVTESLVRTLALAAGVIFLLLLAVFRSIRHALITLAPVVVVVLWTFALIRLFGFSLNFVTGTIAVIAVGIGVDYPLYIVSRFRRLVLSRPDKSEAIKGALQESGWPVAAAAVTSAIGFGMLATAPMPLFMTYGIVASSMILLSLCAALILLPVLLERWG